MSEWQPIETAPKDGSPVLVLGSGWNDPVPTVAVWNEYEEWAEFTGGETIWPAPNHWMPLPEPPK